MLLVAIFAGLMPAAIIQGTLECPGETVIYSYAGPGNPVQSDRAECNAGYPGGASISVRSSDLFTTTAVADSGASASVTTTALLSMTFADSGLIAPCVVIYSSGLPMPDSVSGAARYSAALGDAILTHSMSPAIPGSVRGCGSLQHVTAGVAVQFPLRYEAETREGSLLQIFTMFEDENGAPPRFSAQGLPVPGEVPELSSFLLLVSGLVTVAIRGYLSALPRSRRAR